MGFFTNVLCLQCIFITQCKLECFSIVKTDKIVNSVHNHLHYGNYRMLHMNAVRTVMRKALCKRSVLVCVGFSYLALRRRKSENW